jgi:hypothetical protein
MTAPTYWLRTTPWSVLAWHGCTEQDAVKLRGERWHELDRTAYEVLLRADRYAKEQEVRT